VPIWEGCKSAASAAIGAAMPAVRAKDTRAFLVGSFFVIFFILILVLSRLGVLLLTNKSLIWTTPQSSQTLFSHALQ
jgi:hypothetical protein